MTSDEARELFSAAHDGEIDAETKRAFELALAADAELEAEWKEFTELLREARAIAEEDEETDAPDLLGGVQARLRVRSRGRFYRDRFASDASGKTMLPILLGVVMLLVIAIAWLTIHVVQVQDAAGETSSAADAP